MRLMTWRAISGRSYKMGRDKIRLIRDFTKSGVDVLISDIDVAWMRDPTPFFLRYPQVWPVCPWYTSAPPPLSPRRGISHFRPLAHSAPVHQPLSSPHVIDATNTRHCVR
jgi:hypothetical protein